VQTLNKYLAGSFLLTFVLSLLIVTFIMLLGIVFQVTELIAHGLDAKLVLRILAYGFPEALSYTIPISILSSSLLVFGRLSADGEITAMKACGISLWRIILVPILIAVCCTSLCLFINSELVPRGHFYRRQLVREIGIESPLALIEEGRFNNDFPGLTLYVGKRDGEKIRDIRIYDLRTPGVKCEIRATSGVIREDKEKRTLNMILYDVRKDPWVADRPGAGYAEQWTFKVPVGGKKRKYRPREDDKTFGELMGEIRNTPAAYPHLSKQDVILQRVSLSVELHKRLALSFSCFAFAMLAIPLGIKAHRKESSVGMGISLILVFNFYLFILIAEGLEKRPDLNPHLINWLPVLLSFYVGTVLLNRHN
jgi:lipopolysaccharide export system permease protein